MRILLVSVILTTILFSACSTSVIDTSLTLDQQADILELQSWSWHDEYGYAIAEGQVKNISSKNLNNVEVLVTWYTADHVFITSDSALIEFNPILPGQTSPFKVIATYNPAMDKASINFKFLLGGIISWTKVPKLTPTTIPSPTSNPIFTLTPTPVRTPTPKLTLTDIQTPTPTLIPTTTLTPIPTTPVQSTSGYSRNDPAGIGTAVTTKVDYKGGTSTLTIGEFEVRITVLEIIKGEEAWQRIKTANRYNDPPIPDFEYFLVRIRFECLNASIRDKPYLLDNFHFRAFYSNGQTYQTNAIVVPEPALDSNSIVYAKQSREGWAAFQIAQDDINPLMCYGGNYQRIGSIWFKLKL